MIKSIFALIALFGLLVLTPAQQVGPSVTTTVTNVTRTPITLVVIRTQVVQHTVAPIVFNGNTNWITGVDRILSESVITNEVQRGAGRFGGGRTNGPGQRPDLGGGPGGRGGRGNQ